MEKNYLICRYCRKYIASSKELQDHERTCEERLHPSIDPKNLIKIIQIN